jgi:hypothetical protein
MSLLLRCLAVALFSLAAPPFAFAGEDGGMNALWAASAVQLVFTLVASVGLGTWRRNAQNLDDRVGSLEDRLQNTREVYARRAELAEYRAELRVDMQLINQSIAALRRELAELRRELVAQSKSRE